MKMLFVMSASIRCMRLAGYSLMFKVGYINSFCQNWVLYVNLLQVIVHRNSCSCL